MEGLSADGRAVYNLLCHELANDMDQRLKEHGESLISSMRKLIKENNTTLNNLMS